MKGNCSAPQCLSLFGIVVCLITQSPLNQPNSSGTFHAQCLDNSCFRIFLTVLLALCLTGCILAGCAVKYSSYRILISHLYLKSPYVQNPAATPSKLKIQPPKITGSLPTPQYCRGLKKYLQQLYNPKGPCNYPNSICFGPKVPLLGTILTGQSIYYLGTWTLRVTPSPIILQDTPPNLPVPVEAVKLDCKVLKTQPCLQGRGTWLEEVESRAMMLISLYNIHLLSPPRTLQVLLTYPRSAPIHHLPAAASSCSDLSTYWTALGLGFSELGA